jgi:hypothetical protein
VLKYIGAGILGLVVILGLSWVVTGNDFFLYKYFAPKQAAVQRQVFENTPSYNQGMVQELENFHFQYVKADSAQKPALAAIILSRAAAYGVDKLPSDLRVFVSGLKDAQLNTR